MPPDSDLDIDWTVISMWLPSWKLWLVIEGEQTTEIYVSVGILSLFSSLFFIFFFFFFFVILKVVGWRELPLLYMMCDNFFS